MLVLPALAATAVATGLWPVGVTRFRALALVGGVGLSLIATPLAFLMAWYWRRDVSERARAVIWSLCWLSLAGPLLLLLQIVGLRGLS